LWQSGVEFQFSDRQLTASAVLKEDNRPFTLALLRPKDIEEMVYTKRVNLGIVGSDTVEETRLEKLKVKSFESKTRIQTLLELGIGKCSLVLAAPESEGYLSAEEIEKVKDWRLTADFKCLQQFDGKTLATSYPAIFNSYVDNEEAFLNKDRWEWLGVDIKTTKLGGSIEAAPFLGLADGIVDLVGTGETLAANGLKPLLTIGEYQGVLITSDDNEKGDNDLLDTIRDRLYQVLLEKGEPDAIIRRQRYNQLLRKVAQFR
jgi:ATP phosphoribosyltransferase